MLPYRHGPTTQVTMLERIRDRSHRRFNRAYGAWLCASQANPLSSHPKTIVTTFYDFEGNYGMTGATDRCLGAMPRILEIERRHGIRSTYNIVALYAREVQGVFAL